MGNGDLGQIVTEVTKRWEETRWLKLSNSNICRRMNWGIIVILVAESLDFSRVILQSIPIFLRHIPTKNLKAK